jgi:DNA helicase-2/ATP-dependent DNA helicase PcrA
MKLSDLPPQNQAVSHRQITARAGSGKTQRIASLVVESLKQGAPPESIMAITYGVQAAQELRERILLIAGQELGPTPGLSQMTIGTIHSVCLALLKRHLPRYASYRSLSDAQVYLLLKQNFRALGLDKIRLQDGPQAGNLLDNSIWDLRVLMDVLAVLREGDIDWSHVPKPLRQACRNYKDLMRREHALDYPGLLQSTVQALRNTEDEYCRNLRRYITETVKHLYVDEYQDVSPIQELLIQTFADLGTSITTVGDPSQAIFGWRGCDARYVTTFTQRYGGQQERLENNYRSSAGIVDVAQSFLKSEQSFLSSETDEMFAGTMYAAGHQQTEVGDLQAAQFADPQQEAQYVVRRIQELIGTPFRDQRGGPLRGLTYSDIAVLCRSVSQSAGPTVEALTAAGIPCQVAGLGGLFAAAEVQAVVKSFLFLAGCPEIIRQGSKTQGSKTRGGRAKGGKFVDEQEVTADDVAQAWRKADLGFSTAGIEAGMAYLMEQKALYVDQTQR